MPKTITYEISDEIRADIAKKLDLDYSAQLEIPCTYYYSSNEVCLYLDLNESQNSGDGIHKSELSFLNWYNTKYPAINYKTDADRLGHFINDIICKGAIFYTEEGDRSTAMNNTLICLSDGVKINGIKSFTNYTLAKYKNYTENSNDFEYSLVNNTTGNPVTDIVNNSDIAEGTEFISFYLDMSKHPCASYESRCFVTICK